MSGFENRPPLDANTLKLESAKQELVGRVIDMQLNVTLPSQVRHTRAALAGYGVALASHSAEILAELFDDHTDDEVGDVHWMTQDMSAQAKELYENILAARNEGSLLRRSADLVRVSALARGLGKSGIVLTASGTSAITGAVVHQAYSHATPTAIGLGVGFVAGRSLIPNAVRNSTHRILGKRFDQFLVPVTDDTWEHYQNLVTEREVQGMPDFSLEERAAAVRRIEIDAQIAALQAGLDSAAWNWWQAHKPPQQADAGAAAAALSHSAINQIGRTLGVVNDHNTIPVTHVLTLGV